MMGGNVNITFLLEDTYCGAIEQLKAHYFPDGVSCKGRIEEMDTYLGSAKGLTIPDTNFTIGQFIRNTPTQRPRLYLMTKLRSVVHLQSDSCSSDDDFVLPHITFKRKRQTQVLSNAQTVADTGVHSMVSTTSCISQTGAVNSVSGASPLSHPLHLNDSGTPTISFNLESTQGNCMLCTVCYIEMKNTVLIPCGYVLCNFCASRFVGGGNNCPMCRKPIEKVQNMFL